MTATHYLMCWYCWSTGERGITADADDIETHTARLIEDMALLQALQMVHGKQAGSRRYLEVGGLMHFKTRADALEAGLSEEQLTDMEAHIEEGE
jgi:hypothetical protein